MSSRWAALAPATRPLKNSRLSLSAGPRCSRKALHWAISHALRLWRALAYPRQDFRIAQALFDLRFQRFGIDPRKFEEVLVGGAGIMVFPVLPARVARHLSRHRARMT